jgi:16S rRNA (uracil1498-N3)-methyltransferase
MVYSIICYIGLSVRTIRIYQPGHYKNGDIVELSPGASQHVGTVLRMQPGEKLVLFCGDNREFPATIKAVQKKKVSVSIDAVSNINRESPRTIHLGQAISKGERMELVIQKAVELGVTTITPLLTERCVVRMNDDRLTKKQAQWQAIAIAACEQSGRNQLPTIHTPCSLDVYLQQCQAALKLVLDPSLSKTWRDYTLSEGDIALLIGPEGGLSHAEVHAAQAKGFEPLCLGPRVLRTETAAIAAISILQAIAGDL